MTRGFSVWAPINPPYTIDPDGRQQLEAVSKATPATKTEPNSFF